MTGLRPLVPALVSTPDGTLLYLTGGLALLDANFDDGADSHSETLVGWTAGAGMEQMISDSFSIKAEALYADFGSVDFTLSGDETEIDTELVLVRAGISFHF